MKSTAIVFAVVASLGFGSLALAQGNDHRGRGDEQPRTQQHAPRQVDQRVMSSGITAGPTTTPVALNSGAAATFRGSTATLLTTSPITGPTACRHRRATTNGCKLALTMC